MEKHKVNRVIAITIVFVIIAIFIIWGLAVAYSKSVQLSGFDLSRNVPVYLEDIDRIVNGLVAQHLPDDFRPQLEQV